MDGSKQVAPSSPIVQCNGSSPDECLPRHGRKKVAKFEDLESQPDIKDRTKCFSCYGNIVVFTICAICRCLKARPACLPRPKEQQVERTGNIFF